jgi:uncharacterized protein (UPF0128 family)
MKRKRYMMSSIWHVCVGHLFIFFGRVSLQTFCPFNKNDYLFSYYWVLRVLYIFCIQILYQLCNLNYSLIVQGLFFILVTVSFEEQTF